MNNKKKSKIILRILNKTYPKVPIPLNYKNTFTLLVSVLLSAQCTDVNVNNVTKDIFPKYNILIVAIILHWLRWHIVLL